MASFAGCAKSTTLLVSRRATTLPSVSSPSTPQSSTWLMSLLAGFIFAGALIGFILARLQYLSIGGKFKDGSSPGEWYYLRGGHESIGITIHLVTILPEGFLVVFQVCRYPLQMLLSLLLFRSDKYHLVHPLDPLQSPHLPSHQWLHCCPTPHHCQRRRPHDCSTLIRWRI